jgi:hypothetical protein
MCLIPIRFWGSRGTTEVPAVPLKAEFRKIIQPKCIQFAGFYVSCLTKCFELSFMEEYSYFLIIQQ